MPVIVTPGYLSCRGEMYFQMASQVEAGIPIANVFRNQLENPLHASFSAPLKTIVGCLEQGYPVADSLEAEPGWLPRFDMSLIRAGEKSGRLDECFRLLAEYYRERSELSKRVIGESIYPALVVHMAIVVFPPSALIGLIQGDWLPFFIQKGILFGALYAVLLSLAYVTQREGGGLWQSAMEKVFHRVPLLGTARRHLAFSRLALALEALINAGVGIVQAWPLAAKACGSPTIERAAMKSIPKMNEGWMPSDAIKESDVFPSHFIGLYQTGEHSGKMDETLRRLHAYYQEDGFRKLKHFAFWAPNAVYGLVAIFIVWRIYVFWTDHFKQITDSMG